MNNGPAQEWDESTEGELTVRTVANRYPSHGYRLAEVRMQPGERRGGRMRRGCWYIIAGRCRVHFRTEFVLEQHQVVNMPEGAYSVEALDEETLHYVVAWKLPDGFERVRTLTSST